MDILVLENNLLYKENQVNISSIENWKNKFQKEASQDQMDKFNKK